jgi:hypothetical protein
VSRAPQAFHELHVDVLPNAAVFSMSRPPLAKSSNFL